MKKSILVVVIILLLVTILGGCNSILNKDIKEEEPLTKEDTSKDDVIIEGSEEQPVEESTEDEVVGASDIEVGKLAPNFTLKNLAGEDISLEDYKGKIVLLNFWATWCTWCELEMPDLQKLDKENDDLVVLAVNVMENNKTVKNYIDNGGYEFEVVLDEDGEIAKTYLVSGLPVSYFIDEDGILLGFRPGMMEYDTMVQILDMIREGN